MLDLSRLFRLPTVVLLCAIACFPQKDEQIKLPSSPEDLATGKRLFLNTCGYCHGPSGAGGTGADLSRAQLVHAPTDHDLVEVIRLGVPGTEMPGAYHLTAREITQVAAFVRSLSKVELHDVSGDAANGRKLYQTGGCARCHTVKYKTGYDGGFMGPDLSSIGLLRSPAQLRESVVKPAAVVPEAYVPIKLMTKAGKEIQGTRVYEDTFSIAIRDFEGSNYSFLKADVGSVETDRKSSPMPSYRDAFSHGELEDLIAYLVSLREPL